MIANGDVLDVSDAPWPLESFRSCLDAWVNLASGAKEGVKCQVQRALVPYTSQVYQKYIETKIKMAVLQVMNDTGDDDIFDDEAAVKEECESITYLGRMDAVNSSQFLLRLLTEFCNSYQVSETHSSISRVHLYP
jgi:hypothetical protein